MKKAILFLLFFASVQILSAQELMDKMSKSACNCIEKKNAQNEKMTLDAMMQACVMEAISDNMQEFMAKYGNDMQNQEKMQAVGTELGLRLMKDCPSFTKAAMQAQGGEKAGIQEATSKTISGLGEGLKMKNFYTLTIKANGILEDFVILERFTGSEYIFGKEKEIKGKKFNVSYKEAELYNPAKKSFEKVKVITEVSL
ncbi:MAG: hypothetical protein SFU27_01150 [Thermonemataceae bacterium]|nr:hypothetical protein [Thermonemataceae bacterium]